MNLNKSGRGTLAITGTAAHGGSTTINGQGGVLILSGPGGALSNVSGVTVNAEATLLLDNTGANNNNRLRDAAAITLSGGTLYFKPNAFVASTETCPITFRRQRCGETSNRTPSSPRPRRSARSSSPPAAHRLCGPISAESRASRSPSPRRPG